MLSEALQRNAKHKARLSGFQTSLILSCDARKNRSEIESLASPTSSAALQLRFAQNYSGTAAFVLRHT
jgi:hypothetical protein